MKKLSIFPMTRDQCALPRFAALLQGYEIAHCLTPTFKRLGGADTSHIDGGDITGIALTDFEPALLAHCHTLFIDYDEPMGDIDAYQKVIDLAKEMGKEVITSRLLAGKLSPQQEITAPLVHKTENPETDIIYDIPVPVVMVLSQGIYTDQFATELALRKYFTDIGYKVSQIGSLESSQFFGFPTIPPLLYEPRDMYEKTMHFNRYAKALADKEDPELLIIGAPGAITKYSNMQLQGLGAMPQIVCAAAPGDATALCLYQGDYDTGYLDMLHNLTDYKLESPANFFTIANVAALPNGRYNGAKLEYIHLDSSFVMESIQDMEWGRYGVYNGLSNESMLQAGMAMQTALTDNVDNI